MHEAKQGSMKHEMKEDAVKCDVDKEVKVGPIERNVQATASELESVQGPLAAVVAICSNPCSKKPIHKSGDIQ